MSEQQPIKLRKILDCMPGLQQLAATKLKGQVSFKVGTFLRKAQKHITQFQELQKGLMEEFTSVDATGNRQFTDLKGYNDQLNDLADAEVSDLVVPHVELSDLRVDKLPVSNFASLVGWLLFVEDLPTQEVTLTAQEILDARTELQVLAGNQFEVSKTRGVLLAMSVIQDQIIKIAAAEEGIAEDVRTQNEALEAANSPQAVAEVEVEGSLTEDGAPLTEIVPLKGATVDLPETAKLPAIDLGEKLGEYRLGTSFTFQVPIIKLSTLEDIDVQPGVYSNLLWCIEDDEEEIKDAKVKPSDKKAVKEALENHPA